MIDSDERGEPAGEHKTGAAANKGEQGESVQLDQSNPIHPKSSLESVSHLIYALLMMLPAYYFDIVLGSSLLAVLSNPLHHSSSLVPLNAVFFVSHNIKTSTAIF